MKYNQVKIVAKLRKRRLQGMHLLTALVVAGTLVGCAASRSNMTGLFGGPTEKNMGGEKVSVFFLFKHLEQQRGFDAVPKLKDTGVSVFENPWDDAFPELVYSGVNDFENLFRDALSEISNISEYNTYTGSPQDVNNPRRRQECEELRESHDYTLEIDFLEESSFKQQFLSGTISLLSLTVVPAPYSWDYTITAKLYDKEGKLAHSYQRKATLNNWVQTLLVFVYPFHPLEGKREEIYKESLHDIFRQIETEKVLKG